MSPEKEWNMNDRHQVDRRTFFKTAGLGTFGLMALGADLMSRGLARAAAGNPRRP